MSISDLFRTDGVIGRGTYAALGVIGFAIKHNLDRVVAATWFGRQVGPFNYLAPGARTGPGAPVGDGSHASLVRSRGGAARTPRARR